MIKKKALKNQKTKHETIQTANVISSIKNIVKNNKEINKCSSNNCFRKSFVIDRKKNSKNLLDSFSSGSKNHMNGSSNYSNLLTNSIHNTERVNSFKYLLIRSKLEGNSFKKMSEYNNIKNLNYKPKFSMKDNGKNLVNKSFYLEKNRIININREFLDEGEKEKTKENTNEKSKKIFKEKINEKFKEKNREKGKKKVKEKDKEKDKEKAKEKNEELRKRDFFDKNSISKDFIFRNPGIKLYTLLSLNKK